MTSKELTTSTNYSPATVDSDLAQILAENLGGESLSLGDLPSVSVPAGGNTRWEIPTAEGSQPVSEFTGVIVHQQPLRGRFESNIAAKGTPPACYSNDGIIGIGDPGGECAKCIFNQFGPEGEAKECKEKKALFIVREGEALPLLLRVPPGSLGALRTYMANLATQHRKPFYAVETTLSLEPAVSKQKISFARIKFAKSRDLSPDEANYVASEMRPRILALAGALDARQETMEE